MSNLKNQLIRLGSTNPDLRAHLREIISALEIQSSDEDNWDPAYKKLREEKKHQALKAVKKIDRNHYVVSYRGSDIEVSFDPRQMKYSVRFPKGTLTVQLSGSGMRSVNDPGRTGEAFAAGKIVDMIVLFKEQSRI